MKSPIKKIEIYQKLKKAIDDGIHPAGSFLPNEIALAKHLDISRVTLRSVLAQLAEEKVIERMYPKGTMVCDRNSNIQQPLTFLLPCADYISDTTHFPDAPILRRVFNGFAQAAYEHNYRVEATPISPTNNRDDIDWEKLAHLNSNSMVLAHSFWYHNLFPLLCERRCKVVVLDNQDPLRELYNDYMREWFVITTKRDNALKSTVRYLMLHGNRKIALLHHWIGEKNHPVLRGYLAGIEESGLKYSAWLDVPKKLTPQNLIVKMISDFYHQYKFDALIMDSSIIFKMRFNCTVNQLFGLPDDLSLLMTSELDHNRHLFPALSSWDFPYEQIGRQAALRLLDSAFRPGKMETCGRIIERESTVQNINLVH